jgi:hypothetical protein
MSACASGFASANGNAPEGVLRIVFFTLSPASPAWLRPVLTSRARFRNDELFRRQ